MFSESPAHGERCRSDDQSLGSVVVHDVDSDVAPPKWRRYCSPESSSQARVVPGRRTETTKPTLKFHASTQVSLPVNDSEHSIKQMADAMIGEIEEELESMTAQRDALRRELEWYKAELENKRVLLCQSSAEIARLRASASTSEIPTWWTAAQRQLIAELLQHVSVS